VPESDKRCQKLEESTCRRCMCPRGHTENHKFTPKGSICLTTAMELINSLTFNEIKRLTGLDDVKVSKGRENFEQMRKLAKIYCPADTYQLMVDRIDEHELFCQTDLMIHYRRVGDHCCNCLTCGFFSESTLRNSVFLLFAVAIPVSGASFWQPLFLCSAICLGSWRNCFWQCHFCMTWTNCGMATALLMWPLHARC
jgi:hypothetical protein